MIGSNQDRVCRLESKQARTSGQTLVLVPPVVFVITIFFCIIYNVSWYAQKRVALQEAADTGALAGARIQGMMLEGIAVGNDAIAWNIGQIFKDLGEIEEDPVGAVEDMDKRVGWISQIQNTQDHLTGLWAPAFTMTAGALAAPASGADFAFVLPPASSNVYGYSVKTASSEPSTNVTRPWWGAFIFMLRNSATPHVPAQFPITEKPIVVAYSNLGQDFAVPIPLSTGEIPHVRSKLHLEAPYLVATSASAPYFIPENRPDERSADLSSDPQYAFLREISLMIPGPFWGARLDQVGNQGLDESAGGWAIWAGKYIISNYVLRYINKAVKDAMWHRFNMMRDDFSGRTQQFLNDFVLVGDEDELESETEEGE
jgi:hypothetical protein